MSRPRIVAPDHFGVLFALLLLLFVVVPIVQERRWGFVVTLLVTFSVFVVALSAVGLSRRVILVGAGVTGLASVVLTGVGMAYDEGVVEWVTALLAVMLFATTALVLRRILLQPRVTMSTVAGALCAYLLVGMAFGSLFRTVSGLDADAFTQELGAESTYFGFVTLTTLGYGDIAPVSDVARSLATLEAVIGQVLLVVLVARFVGMLGETREPLVGPRARARRSEHDAEA